MKHSPLISIVLAVVAMFLVGLACRLPGPPNECTNFTIPPSGNWNASLFDTGIELNAGQTVVISAKGTVRPSTAKDVSAGPDGTTQEQVWQDSFSFVSDWAHEAVIARIGGGDYILIGSGQQFTVESGGILELGVNDTDPGNNEGSFEVEICR
jgi:hypothetical protein